MHVSQILINDSVAEPLMRHFLTYISRKSELFSSNSEGQKQSINKAVLMGCILTGLAVPTQAIAHGSKLNVPDFGLGIELELEQHLTQGLPDDRNYQVMTPLYQPAEALENGFNSAEFKLALTSALDNGWLIHGAISNHSHDGSSEFQLDQAFIQSERSKERPWQLRIGRFYSDIGFYNAEGHNNLLYPNAPLVYQGLMGEELSDEGVQLSYRFSHGSTVGVEVFSGENNIAGQRHNSRLSQTQTLYLDQGFDLSELGHLDLKLAYLHSDQNYQSSESDHSHGNSDVSYQLKGQLNQIVLSGRWQYQDLQLVSELIKRQQDSKIVTSDQFLDLDDNSYGFYGLISYAITPKWQISSRYDRLTQKVDSYGHSELFTTLGIDPKATPENISFVVNYSPNKQQLWSVNLSQFKRQWQDEDTGWYGGISYRLNFGAEMM